MTRRGDPFRIDVTRRLGRCRVGSFDSRVCRAASTRRPLSELDPVRRAVAFESSPSRVSRVSGQIRIAPGLIGIFDGTRLRAATFRGTDVADRHTGNPQQCGGYDVGGRPRILTMLNLQPRSCGRNSARSRRVKRFAGAMRLTVLINKTTGHIMAAQAAALAGNGVEAGRPPSSRGLQAAHYAVAHCALHGRMRHRGVPQGAGDQRGHRQLIPSGLAPRNRAEGSPCNTGSERRGPCRSSPTMASCSARSVCITRNPNQ